MPVSYTHLDVYKRQECEAARKAKKERTRWGIVGAIIVVFAVVVILLNTNLFYSGTTALTDVYKRQDYLERPEYGAELMELFETMRRELPIGYASLPAPRARMAPGSADVPPGL